MRRVKLGKSGEQREGTARGALRRRGGGNGGGIAGGTAVRPPTKPPIGSYVVDTHTGRVGMVMGHEGPYVQLRPLGGGKEWDCAPDAVRRATAAERLSAATACANARSRGEVP
ncbi:hypothetical protein SAMN05442782_4388 [Streptomyces sp. OK228]|nr:hypothetical protein SAMN05442782_4388 [Streptomyces sp. OK228]